MQIINYTLAGVAVSQNNFEIFDKIVLPKLTQHFEGLLNFLTDQNNN